MAVLHDDMDRGQRAQGVTLQRTITVDRPVRGNANPIVERRERQNFNLVRDARHAFDPFHDILGIGLQRGPRHGAKQSYG